MEDPRLHIAVMVVRIVEGALCKKNHYYSSLLSLFLIDILGLVQGQRGAAVPDHIIVAVPAKVAPVLTVKVQGVGLALNQRRKSQTASLAADQDHKQGLFSLKLL